METNLASIDGTWTGSYGYGGGRLPVQFDASFSLKSDQTSFDGKISDNGPLGDAQVEGTLNGRNVSFTKYYVSPLTDARTSKVAYSGVLSDDGNSISGRWKIGIFMSGPWQIFRTEANGGVAAGQSWPPLSVAYDAPSLNRSADLPPMTFKRFGGQLTLNKPSSPTVIGQKGAYAGLLLCTFFAIGFCLWAIVQVVETGADYFLIKSIIYSSIGSFALVRLDYIWYRMIRYGDIYVLDRDKDRIFRNLKNVGKFSAISSVELRSVGGTKLASTVTILMKDGRRIFVETGHTADTTEIANNIAQFAGVSVVSGE